jgi:hypothetical protein
VDVTVVDQTPLRYELPSRAGHWVGHDIRYCQNPRCRREFDLASMPDPKACPDCGGTVDIMSLGERQLLPPDTVILKKRYFDDRDRDLFVSVVFSGKERVSIHRPQICLVGQGRRIVSDSVISVPIPGRAPLQVMVLDIIHPVTTADGTTYELPRYYAYWFVGADRETPYHWQRMLWMGVDRVFRNIAHRWAYIAIGGARSLEDDSHKQEIAEFVADFYPQMMKPTGDS